MPHDVAELSPSAHAGMLVDEALRLPCLREAHLVAGKRGTGRRIRGVNVMEDADIVRWMRGGELLLTTGYSVRDDPSALCRLIPALADRGLAGLALKLGLYVEELPVDARLIADRLAFPIIALRARTMFDDILSEVLGTILNRQAMELERSSAIHARLTAVALEGGSFTELAEAVEELIHRPVAIRDAHGLALAVSGAIPDDARGSCVAHPIRSSAVDYGEIVVWTEGGELARDELQTMEHAATVAATALAQERALVSSELRHRTLLLMQLVSRTPVDRTETTRWATAMGWNLDVPRGVVLVELRGGDGPLSVAGQPIETQLARAARQAVGGDAIVCGLGSGLALLVEPSPSLGEVCRALRTALRRADAVAAVMVAAGSLAETVDGLGRSYEEAVSALALGRELYGEDFALEHEELGVYRLLSRLDTDELRAHHRTTLGPLTEYDRTHQGALVHTLDVFLRCERNRVRAARELFVHYNTLRYRLTQIERLTGALRGDPMSRLNVELAMCAHRLLRGRGET